MFKMTETRNIAFWIVVVMIALLATQARGVQIQDVVRLKGSESNKLVGMGLVVGLNGTGDGGKYAPAMQPLAEVIARLIDANTVWTELKDVKNVALVSLSAELPPEGVREGDRVDVHVASVGPAKSLKGGRLLLVPMKGPLQGSPVFAFAEGAVIVEDEDSPTSGVVARGAQLTRDVMSRYLDDAGRITLVIDQANASWPVANTIAGQINGVMAPDGPRIAKALDQKNVVVEVPPYQREDPAQFISNILVTYLDPGFVSSGAKVTINERTGTIVIGGDVQVSPAIISHQGLTITTLTPKPEPTVFEPTVETADFVKMDPSGRGGAKLEDLLNAFNQLKVPAQDRIEILKLMHASGKLHAELVLE